MSEKSSPINIYGILNEELERLHAMARAIQVNPTSPYGNNALFNPVYTAYQANNHTLTMDIVWTRIREVQEVLLTALKEHDSLIQEKVAELALTSKEIQ